MALGLASFTGYVGSGSIGMIGKGFPGFFLWDNGSLVSFHRADWTGPGAGLPLNGGRVVGFEGGAFDGGDAILDRAAAVPVGTPLRYEVLHEGVRRDFVVPTMQLGGADWFLTFGNYLLNAVFCFAIAVLALALRPELPASRALATVMVLLGTVLVLSLDLFTTYALAPGYFLAQALTPA